jgi:signal transduction histidine kinase
LLRVLLIEDNAGDAELVRIRLRELPAEPHELVVAESLQDGLVALSQAPRDIVLLDLNLPDSDGLDTLRNLRAAWSDKPIVVLTGTDDLDTAVAALREGADDYLAKSELTREGILGRALRYGIERRRTLTELHFAVRAREELLQIVSHDIRNQIGTIELAGRMLRKSTSPEEVERRVGAIQRASATSLRLLDDLVDLAALEKGGLVVNVTELDLAPLLSEVHLAFLPMAEHSGVRLELAHLEGYLGARADAVRVTQVLGNLLGNALKFTPRGGAVTLGASASDGAIILHVADTGPGIPAVDRGRIFERFFRGSKPSGKGAGLGLAIARALVEAQRGDIWLESEEGRGAKFLFSLPRVGSARAIGASPAHGA